jgi:hypothetical protein
MRFAGWGTKATDTHSEYVILLFTSTVVMPMRLNFTFVHTLLVLSMYSLNGIEAAFRFRYGPLLSLSSYPYD